MAEGFYVDLISGRKVALIAGPFKTHEAALAIKDRALALADELDQWAWFYTRGTCRYSNCVKVGVLNSRLGLPATVEECLK